MKKWREVVWLDLETAAMLDRIAAELGKPTNVVIAEIISRWLREQRILPPAQEIENEKMRIKEQPPPGARPCRICGDLRTIYHGKDAEGEFHLCIEHAPDWVRDKYLNTKKAVGGSENE